MFVHMTNAAFETLQGRANYSNKIEKFIKTGDRSGVVITPDVTLDFNYDPMFEKFFMSIGKRHSLASRIANETAMCYHLMDLFSNLEAVPVEVSEPKPVLKPVTGGK